jgi:hypothetical protein
VASQSRTGALERLLSHYQSRHKEAAQELGVPAAQRASYYQAATQVFAFELARRDPGGKPEALAVWTKGSSPDGLEDLREEMRRVAAPPLELPAVVA